MAAGLFGTGRQINQINQVAIQPAGIPSSPTIAPQRIDTSSNLQRLSQSLGGLSDSLNNLSIYLGHRESDPESKDNREWIAKRQQMSIEQLREEVKNNTPNGNRIREDSLYLLLGERANDDFRKRWTEYYNTEFDRTAGDADIEFERMRQETVAGIDNEIAKGNFYKLTEPYKAAWMVKDTETKVENTKEQINTTIVDGFRNFIDDAMNFNGRSADEAVHGVFQKSASNREFLGLSPQEQNETIYKLAEEFALKGNEDIVRALLSGTRVDEHGKPLPPLQNTSAYASKSVALIKQAADIKDKELQKNGFSTFDEVYKQVDDGTFTKDEASKLRGNGPFSDSDLASMVRLSRHNKDRVLTKAAEDAQKRVFKQQNITAKEKEFAQAFNSMEKDGGINDIHDVDVPNQSGTGFEKLTKEEIKETVIARKESDFNDLEEKLLAEGNDPKDVSRTVNRVRVDFYARNGISNDAWANKFTSAASLVTSDTLLQKGEVSEYMQGVFSLYRDLKAVNPAYVSTLVRDTNSKRLFDAYERAYTMRGMSNKEAMVYAAQSVNKATNLKVNSLLEGRDLDNVVSKTLRSLSLENRAVNDAIVRQMAMDLSLDGATKDEVQQILKKELTNSAMSFNGVLFFNHHDLPPDFLPLLEKEVQSVFEKSGKSKGIEDLSDLYVEADSSEGKWYVKSKSLGGVIVDATPITASSLQKRREIETEDYNNKIAKLASEHEEEQLAALKKREAKRADLIAKRNEYAEKLKSAQGWSETSLKSAIGRIDRQLHNMEFIDLLGQNLPKDHPKWKLWKSKQINR